MTTPTKHSLIFGGFCALIGTLFGLLVFLDAQVGGYRWFFIPVGLSAFLCGAAFWCIFPERIPRHRLVWGTFAGALVGLVSHYFTWYFVLLGAGICFRLAPGCTSTLLDPPANLLESVSFAAGLSVYSLLIVGWLTVLIGAGLGFFYALLIQKIWIQEN